LKKKKNGASLLGPTARGKKNEKVSNSEPKNGSREKGVSPLPFLRSKKKREKGVRH